MSIFILKLIACITMVLDHIKYAIPETKNFITIYMGRMSLPIFCFLLVEGYFHTSNLTKYYKRLLITAIVSQIPFMLFRRLVGEWLMLNIIFTLILGLNAIVALDKCKNKFISIPFAILMIVLGKVINVDYDWYGVLVIVLFYIFKKIDKKWLMLFGFLILNFIRYYKGLKFNFDYYKYSYLFTTLPIILIMFYNGKLGPKTKYLYYIFYPVHMLIIYLISIYTFGINI